MNEFEGRTEREVLQMLLDRTLPGQENWIFVMDALRGLLEALLKLEARIAALESRDRDDGAR